MTTSVATPGAEATTQPQRGGLGSFVANLGRYPIIPLLILAGLLFVPAIFADVIAPHDPVKINLSDRLQPPAWLEGGSFTYFLGTDRQGFDILSRIVHGARISLAISLLAIALGGGVGTLLGLIAAYRGGWVDTLIMRIVDIKLASRPYCWRWSWSPLWGADSRLSCWLFRCCCGPDSPVCSEAKPCPSRSRISSLVRKWLAHRRCAS